MRELLKKINGNLIEIKSNINKNSFHISGGEGNIGQQITNIQNSYTFYKPLKIVDKKFNIKITQKKISNQVLKAAKLGLLFAAIILSLLVSSDFTDIFVNGIISFLMFATFFYFSFHVFFIFLYFFSSKGTLKINEKKMIFQFKKNKKNIEFRNIRSIRKEKNFFGYTIYIYEETDLYNSISFHIESIDISLAIEELIKSKINEAQKKNIMQQ